MKYSLSVAVVTGLEVDVVVALVVVVVAAVVGRLKSSKENKILFDRMFSMKVLRCNVIQSLCFSTLFPSKDFCCKTADNGWNTIDRALKTDQSINLFLYLRILYSQMYGLLKCASQVTSFQWPQSRYNMTTQSSSTWPRMKRLLP